LKAFVLFCLLMTMGDCGAYAVFYVYKFPAKHVFDC
jgi:hypothetical protein